MGSIKKNKTLGVYGTSIFFLAFVVAAAGSGGSSSPSDTKETCDANSQESISDPKIQIHTREAISLDGIAEAISKSGHLRESVKAICASTDFKNLCAKSLAEAKNSNDPKDLVKAAFTVAWENITDAIGKSALLRRAAKDPRTNQALDICKEVLDHSIDDLKRSFGVVEGSKTINDEHSNDLKVWLSAAITFENTCLDAFQNTSGSTGEKMKVLLKTSIELTSNALAMVTQLSELLKTLEIPGLSRRLLEDSKPVNESGKAVNSTDEEFPQFVDASTRRLLAAPPVKPDIVVAKDGSGKFTTISAAIASLPPTNTKTTTILVKAGVYAEYVTIPRKMTNVVLMGEDPTKTVITGNKNNIDGVATYKSATLTVEGDGFVGRDLTIENKAGAAKHQAVALRVSADMVAIHNCHIEGFQDTLYTHSYRQFYRDCTISGTIDFIFGDGSAVLQGCKMVVRKPEANQACMVTAQGRKERRGVSGIVIQASQIIPEPALKTAQPPVKVFLGRPWKEFSRTIIMSTFIDGIVVPEGWSPWMGTIGLDTCWYAEYQNRGPGASLVKRVNWRGYKRNISPEIAKEFTAGVFIELDTWIKRAGIPYASGFMN